MQTILQIAGIMLALMLLWLGFKKIELSSLWKAVLTAIEAFVLVVSVVSLGWLGLGIAVGATVLGLLVWSVRLAMQQDSLLTAASVRAQESRGDVQALHARLLPQKAFATLGPIALAGLIRSLAHCGRKTGEIEMMAPPIAMLSVAHDCDAVQLAGQFDRLLRLYGESPANAMRVADMLTASTLESACGFTEMLTACLAAAGPAPEL